MVIRFRGLQGASETAPRHSKRIPRASKRLPRGPRSRQESARRPLSSGFGGWRLENKHFFKTCIYCNKFDVEHINEPCTASELPKRPPRSSQRKQFAMRANLVQHNASSKGPVDQMVYSSGDEEGQQRKRRSLDIANFERHKQFFAG